MPRIQLAAVGLMVLAIRPTSLHAQAPVASIGATRAALMESARLRPPAPALSLTSHTGALYARSAGGNTREGEVLMIVGAAAIVTGVLVDSDLITIAGAAVGCFGFYLYLEGSR